MTPIAEAIILHSLSVWECHVKFSSIYIPSDFTEETWSIGFVYQIPGADQYIFSFCRVQGKPVRHKPFA